MGLIKTKERVSKHGEVFTPTHIVDAMHNIHHLFSGKGSKKDKKAWEEMWKDPTMIYLEPTCGNGQFVVRAIEKKLSNGLKVEDACNTVFGMDIMGDNIKECRLEVLSLAKRWLEKNSPLFTDRIERVSYIVYNNIFQVKDSLEYMKSGAWNKKRFYDEDPTDQGNQILNDKDRATLEAKVAAWRLKYER